MGRGIYAQPFIHMTVHDEDAFDIKIPTFVFALLPDTSSCLHVP